MKSLLVGSLRAAVRSALLVLQYIVPFYILADVLLYFDLLKYLGFLFSPLTKLLDLPPEAAVALAGGVCLNIYAAIAFAAPLDLTPYQWTVLAVFLGVCHSIVVESSIMKKLGIRYRYSVVLRCVGAWVVVLPVLFLPPSLFATGLPTTHLPVMEWSSPVAMLLHSVQAACILSVKIIALISVLIVVMDLLKATSWVQAHAAKVNTSFSLLAGQLLGITYGAGILFHEVEKGSLSQENILFIGTFLMICHSLIEDVVLFVLFGANYWIIISVRLVFAVGISFAVLHLFRMLPLKRIVLH